MNSDLNNLRKMLESKLIPYVTTQFNNQTTIKIVRGNPNCATIFIFDINGEFIDMGAYG